MYLLWTRTPKLPTSQPFHHLSACIVHVVNGKPCISGLGVAFEFLAHVIVCLWDLLPASTMFWKWDSVQVSPNGLFPVRT